MTTFLFIKNKLLIFCLFVCFNSCYAEVSNEYMGKCLKNSLVFPDKVLKVRMKVKDIGVLDDFFVLKHAAVSEALYSFSLIGIKDNSGLFLYMDDSMIEPSSIELEYNLASGLIRESKSAFGTESFNSFSTAKINGGPCYFINFDGQKENVTLALAGISDDEQINELIRKIEKLALYIEINDSNVDFKPNVNRNIGDLSIANIFDEIKYLRNKK